MFIRIGIELILKEGYKTTTDYMSDRDILSQNLKIGQNMGFNVLFRFGRIM